MGKDDWKVANLDPKQMEQLSRFEKELGVVLVAYDTKKK